MDTLSLASDFPHLTEADWLKLVQKALAGAPPSRLNTELYESIVTKPLYTPSDLAATPPCALPNGRGWQTLQSLDGMDEAGLAAEIEQAAQGDVEGLRLHLDFVLAPVTAQWLSELFGRVKTQTPFAFYLDGEDAITQAAVFAAAFPDPSGFAGIDPLTSIAVIGEIPADRANVFAPAVDAALYLRERCPNFTPLMASDKAFHLAGGSATHEIGCTLAAAVAYWRALGEAGLALADAARCIGFSLTATCDIFLTIAKFRAFRMIWHKALAAAGVEWSGPVPIVGEMSSRVLTERDPYVNLLRGTAAAFGAALGGATVIHVHPFNHLIAADAPSRELARRMARNTSLILKHESSLGTVADAAHGSFYLESLSNALAEKAWALLQDIEGRGGLAKLIENGGLNAEFFPVAQKRMEAIATRREKITGVSAFANLEETLPKIRPSQMEDWPVIDRDGENAGNSPSRTLTLPRPGKGERFAALVEAAKGGAPLADLIEAAAVVNDFIQNPLRLMLSASRPFEILRRRSDQAFEMLGSRPPVFIARLGAADEHRARALWLQSLFATGGIEAIMPENGCPSVEAVLAGYKDNPSPVVCLCGADAAYRQMVGLAPALKNAGALFVYLAAPASVVSTLQPDDAAAIDRLVYEGCDVVQTLEELHSVLRVEDFTVDDEMEQEKEGE